MLDSVPPIRIGLVGLGSWARSAYVPVLQELPEVTVRAVSARTEETLGLAGRLFGSEVDLYTDYNHLIADPNVGVVMIGLLNEGVLLPQSCGGDLSLLTTESHVDTLVDAVRRVTGRVRG